MNPISHGFPMPSELPPRKNAARGGAIAQSNQHAKSRDCSPLLYTRRAAPAYHSDFAVPSSRLARRFPSVPLEMRFFFPWRLRTALCSQGLLGRIRRPGRVLAVATSFPFRRRMLLRCAAASVLQRGTVNRRTWAAVARRRQAAFEPAA